MNKFYFLIIALNIFGFTVFGQQFENASFEEWEDAGTVIDEPVNWSSIKTSDAGTIVNNAAPVVWGQSDDAHTGSYSLQLTNVLTIGSIIATGTVTNGRIHASFIPAEGNSYTNQDDPRWNTPLTGRPDSVAVWIKYYPASDQDTAQVKVLLHKGEGSIPETPENVSNRVAFAQINVWGEQDTWIRVAAPFNYLTNDNPEYVLAILTAGAGLAPITGSVAFYDDIELVYDPSSIRDHSLGKNLISSYGKTLHLDNLPADYINNSQLELIDLNGASIWSSQVNSSTIKVDYPGLRPGLYIVRIKAQQGVYSQKIQLW